MNNEKTGHIVGSPLEIKDIRPSGREVTFARKPRLPKKLIILSVEWDILYFDKQIDVDEDKEEHLFGQIIWENNTIRVFRGKRKRENIFETIFHEWTHIILIQMDYRWAFTRTDEERFVHAFSNALNDLFWRNFRG